MPNNGDYWEYANMAVPELTIFNQGHRHDTATF
jgi:hypothetical protein